jgi:hypothetical protein
VSTHQRIAGRTLQLTLWAPAELVTAAQPPHLQVKRGQNLNEHANFENFGRSLLTLFRIATADAWTGIMVDASVQPPHCDEALGECGTMAAPVYIMSFAIVIGQIVLNLFTTIVIETFEEMDEVRFFSPLDALLIMHPLHSKQKLALEMALFVA